jgi:hypothetical protein
MSYVSCAILSVFYPVHYLRCTVPFTTWSSIRTLSTLIYLALCVPLHECDVSNPVQKHFYKFNTFKIYKYLQKNIFAYYTPIYFTVSQMVSSSKFCNYICTYGKKEIIKGGRAVWSCIDFCRSNIGIVGSNSSRGTDVWFFFPYICLVLCRYSLSEGPMPRSRSPAKCLQINFRKMEGLGPH